MDEFELIRRYFQSEDPVDGVVLGIGDDGAVVAPTPGLEQVVVVDTLVEGVHFPEAFNPADIGYRVAAVNLSDIAAMGAVPRFMTLALSMPHADPEWLGAFAGGLRTAAKEFDVALIGGDTTSCDRVVVTVQVTGEIEAGKAIKRSGARTGDAIYVTGTLGDAAAGLAGLRSGRSVRPLVDRFARPSARVAYGRSLVGVASAAIDLSDGLLGDLRKLLEASAVGAEIDVDALPFSAALEDYCEEAERRRFALSGGDDYELCFTAPAAPPDPGIMPLTRIGKITSGGSLICRDKGEIVDIGDPDDRGYRHFQ